MSEIEAVLVKARLLMSRGQPLPVDLLAQADELGIELSSLDQPKQQTNHETT